MFAEQIKQIYMTNGCKTIEDVNRQLHIRKTLRENMLPFKWFYGSKIILCLIFCSIFTAYNDLQPSIFYSKCLAICYLLITIYIISFLVTYLYIYAKVNKTIQYED